MQTFLPYPDYEKSAKSLDRSRLGKQRVECLQILNALLLPSYGWKNHPATKMWRGHELSLVNYAFAIIAEWRSRGYKDTVSGKIRQLVENRDLGETPPSWEKDDRLYISHQSNLIRKLPEYYQPQFPNVSGDLPYFWPV